MKRYEYTLFADYFQFYLQDESVEGVLVADWTEDAFARLLAVAPGTIVIRTVRNMMVPVVVEIHEREPSRDLDHWDHVVESGLELSTGRIVIAGFIDDFPEADRIQMEAGEYRTRISYGSLDQISENGLDGDDHYCVQLWPGDSIEPVVLKERRN